jgi:hypothetical protein
MRLASVRIDFLTIRNHHTMKKVLKVLGILIGLAVLLLAAGAA